jgi:hypothetical protein
VTIKTNRKDGTQIVIEETQEAVVTELLNKLYFSLVKTFPHFKDTVTLSITPEER